MMGYQAAQAAHDRELPPEEKPCTTCDSDRVVGLNVTSYTDADGKIWTWPTGSPKPIIDTPCPICRVIRSH